MKHSARFRSVSRAAAFVVGLAPLLWLSTAFSAPILTSIEDLAMTLVIFGPAAACAFGMAYLVHYRSVAWFCTVAAVGSFLMLLGAYNASESSTAALAFMMVSPAYIVVFLVGFLGEAGYRNWRAPRIGANH